MRRAGRWLRIGAICSQLHVLPRIGGVLDQDPRDVAYLEKILESLGRYRQYEENKRKARRENRDRHAPQRFREQELVT